MATSPLSEPDAAKRIFDAAKPLRAAHIDVVRNYLRFYGPARPNEVAAFLDAPVKEITAHWPTDAVSADVTDGPAVKGERSMLPDDVSAATSGTENPGHLRLLGPYDGYLQLKDRPLLVGDAARAKDLWRALGRPGAVALDGEVIGTWRPRTSGGNLMVTWDPWQPATKALHAGVAEQAEKLADVRGLRLKDVAQA